MPNLQNLQRMKIANLSRNNAVELVVINRSKERIMSVFISLAVCFLHLQSSQLAKVQDRHWEWTAQLIVAQINIYHMH